MEEESEESPPVYHPLLDEEEAILEEEEEQGEEEQEVEELEEEEEEDEEEVVPVPFTEDELSDDAGSLYDVPTGFLDPGNLRKPLLGFSDTDERTIFPSVEKSSSVLFEIVQTLENKQLESSRQILLSHNKKVVIPQERLDGTSYPKYRLRYYDPRQPQVQDDQIVLGQQEEEEEELEEEEDLNTPLVVTPAQPDKISDRLLAAIATDAFPPPKLEQLQLALDKGWTREIVMRSHCSAGKKLGDVYYFSPEGTKFRSSKQVALYIGKKPELGLTIDNFSFAKARVSYDPKQESVRQAYAGKSPMPSKQQVRIKNTTQKYEAHQMDDSSQGRRGGGYDSNDLMIDEDDDGSVANSARGSAVKRSIQPPKRYSTGDNAFFADKRPKLSKSNQDYDDDGSMEMGMLPPKYHKGLEDTSSAGNSVEDPYADFKRRGRPPKPGGKKDRLAQAEAMKAAQIEAASYNSEEEGAMFGISAFTQSAQFLNQGSGYYFDGAYDQIEYNEESAKGDVSGNTIKEDGEVTGETGEGLARNSKGQLIPCSIRCPGMTGEIPTLRCFKCLCLYHPGCLGLPQHQTYRNFSCSNCDAIPDDNSRHQLQSQSTSLQRAHDNFVVKGRLGDGGNELPQQKKKPPPPLIRANFSNPKGQMPNRMEPRKILPKMPILQPPSSTFIRSNKSSSSSISGGIMKIRPGMMPTLNPPPLKKLHLVEKPPGSFFVPQMKGSPLRRMIAPGKRLPTLPWRHQPASGQNPVLPNLNRSSLTITPISLQRKGQQPQSVPKLQNMLQGPSRGMQQQSRPLPMKSSKGGLIRPNIASSQNQGRVPNFQPNPQHYLPPRATGVGYRTPEDQGIPNAHPYPVFPKGIKKPVLVHPRPPKMGSVSGGPILHRQTQFRLPPIRSSTNSRQRLGQATFRKYAQSVVSINQKKYIALPKMAHNPVRKLVHVGDAGDTEETIEMNINKVVAERIRPYDVEEVQSEEDTEDSMAFGLSSYDEANQDLILKSVFSKLDVMDLLTCSVVSETWRTAAVHPDLWETIRLKDLRIVDWQKLCNLILVRGTEILDARGLIIEDLKEGWDRLSSLVMSRPTKLIVSPRMLDDKDGMMNFVEDNPNCEVFAL